MSRVTHGQALAHRKVVAFVEGGHGQTCPDCRREGRGDSPLNIDLKTTKFDPATGKYSVVRAAFCVACEFVAEF